MKSTDLWGARIQHVMRERKCSREEASRIVRAEVFGEEEADRQMETAGEEKAVEEEALKHLDGCSFLGEEWFCVQDCPIWNHEQANERETRRWRWGKVE